MLDWSISELSKVARVSVATVARIERMRPAAEPDKAQDAIQHALERNGVRFLPDDGDGPGVRLRHR